jgi:hemin uptake protein HemP
LVSDIQPPRRLDPNASNTGNPTAHRGRDLRVTSSELLGSQRELVIVHAGREYRLRVTQNGKLILTA